MDLPKHGKKQTAKQTNSYIEVFGVEVANGGESTAIQQGANPVWKLTTKTEKFEDKDDNVVKEAKKVAASALAAITLIEVDAKLQRVGKKVKIDEATMKNVLEKSKKGLGIAFALGTTKLKSYKQSSSKVYVMVGASKDLINKSLKKAIKEALKFDEAIWKKFQANNGSKLLDEEFPSR